MAAPRLCAADSGLQLTSPVSSDHTRGRDAQRRDPGRPRFVCLGINKHLDLQSLLTLVGRIFAHQQGWCDQHCLAAYA
jgi:hypothetical protein